MRNEDVGGQKGFHDFAGCGRINGVCQATPPNHVAKRIHAVRKSELSLPRIPDATDLHPHAVQSAPVVLNLYFEMCTSR